MAIISGMLVPQVLSQSAGGRHGIRNRIREAAVGSQRQVDVPHVYVAAACKLGPVNNHTPDSSISLTRATRIMPCGTNAPAFSTVRPKSPENVTPGEGNGAVAPLTTTKASPRVSSFPDSGTS